MNKPDESVNSKTFALFSVADGKITQHCVRFLGGQAADGMIADVKNLNLYDEIKSDETEASGVTELAVFQSKKRNRLFFMIGKFDGSIELYALVSDSCEVQKLCTLYNHQKLITCIKWSKMDDSDGSNLVASGSNDFNVVVLDFDSVLEEIEKKKNEQEENKKLDLKFFAKYKHKLCGHRERITGLSWSRSREHLLASCSYDATVQVSR